MILKYMKYKKVIFVTLQTVSFLPLLIVFTGVVWQVFSRYIFSVPSKYSEELIRFSLVFLTFLAGAFCFVSNGHIALDLLEPRENKKGYLFISIFRVLLIFLFASIILIYGGLNKAISQIHQLSSSLNVSMFYVYLIMPFSGLIISVWSIVNLYKLFFRS